MIFLSDIATFARKKGSKNKVDKTPYANPGLRERLKREIKASGKGGKPGQWSAIKSNILAKKYKESGGGYKDTSSKPQQNLRKWNGEKWRTSDGKPAIRKNKSGKTVTTRFLPDEAWEKLSPSQVKATNQKKVKASKKGMQFVSNTKAAIASGREARS